MSKNRHNLSLRVRNDLRGKIDRALVIPLVSPPALVLRQNEQDRFRDRFALCQSK